MNVSEGILKFVYPNHGVGRFTKLGLPAPALTANFVGGLEIVGGILPIAGLFTRTSRSRVSGSPRVAGHPPPATFPASVSRSFGSASDTSA
jgi:hypothetical protein